MLMEATSLSPWMKTPCTSGILLAKYSGISFWGVMGYPAKKRHPARTAASAMASQPFINTLAIFLPISLPDYLYISIAASGHMAAHILHATQEPIFGASTYSYPFELTRFPMVKTFLGQNFTQ
jgi:hypothetical protein